MYREGEESERKINHRPCEQHKPDPCLLPTEDLQMINPTVQGVAQKFEFDLGLLMHRAIMFTRSSGSLLVIPRGVQKVPSKHTLTGEPCRERHPWVLNGNHPAEKKLLLADQPLDPM